MRFIRWSQLVCLSRKTGTISPQSPLLRHRPRAAFARQQCLPPTTCSWSLHRRWSSITASGGNGGTGGGDGGGSGTPEKKPGQGEGVGIKPSGESSEGNEGSIGLMEWFWEDPNNPNEGETVTRSPEEEYEIRKEGATLALKAFAYATGIVSLVLVGTSLSCCVYFDVWSIAALSEKLHGVGPELKDSLDSASNPLLRSIAGPLTSAAKAMTETVGPIVGDMAQSMGLDLDSLEDSLADGEPSDVEGGANSVAEEGRN